MAALNKLPEDDQQMFHHPFDPSSDIRTCELPGCHERNALGNMYCMVANYALAGPMHGAFQCPERQHLACCHEHAMLLCMHCMIEHMHVGPHAQYGDELSHSKLKRIAKILNEPYRAGVEKGGSQ